MQELMRFQTDRGLNKKEYVALNEHANIMEELLESIGLDVPKANRPKLIEALSHFVNEVVIETGIADQVHQHVDDTPVEDQVDAYCDIITYCTGAIMKLGYDPIKSIEECGKEINSRAGSMVDGKFEKDLSPEAKANWYKADYSVAKVDHSDRDCDGQDWKNE